MTFRPFLIAAAAIVLLAGVVYTPVAAIRSTVDYRTVTVQEKAPSTDSKPYLVFTTAGDTYSVEDSLAFWNFRASDRYGDLRVGHTYRCKTAGWRFGPTSSYRNLLDCSEVRA